MCLSFVIVDVHWNQSSEWQSDRDAISLAYQHSTVNLWHDQREHRQSGWFDRASRHRWHVQHLEQRSKFSSSSIARPYPEKIFEQTVRHWRFGFHHPWHKWNKLNQIDSHRCYTLFLCLTWILIEPQTEDVSGRSHVSVIRHEIIYKEKKKNRWR